MNGAAFGTPCPAGPTAGMVSPRQDIPTALWNPVGDAAPPSALPPPATSPHRQARHAAPDGEWEGWMASAQAGDGRAYDQLLHAALPLLRGVARRRLVNPSEAEEAVQDALLTIHEIRHAYDPERPIRPWLIAITERRAIDRLRRSLRRAGRETPLEPFAETLAGSGPEAAFDHLRALELRAMIATLPPTQRTALTLAKLEDLPLAEASRRSGISVGALKVATHRALRSLRKRLAVRD